MTGINTFWMVAELAKIRYQTTTFGDVHSLRLSMYSGLLRGVGFRCVQAVGVEERAAVRVPSR